MDSIHRVGKIAPVTRIVAAKSVPEKSFESFLQEEKEREKEDEQQARDFVWSVGVREVNLGEGSSFRPVVVRIGQPYYQSAPPGGN